MMGQHPVNRYPMEDLIALRSSGALLDAVLEDFMEVIRTLQESKLSERESWERQWTELNAGIYEATNELG